MSEKSLRQKNPNKQTLGCFVPCLVEIGLLVLEEKIFKYYFFNAFLLFCNPQSGWLWRTMTKDKHQRILLSITSYELKIWHVSVHFCRNKTIIFSSYLFEQIIYMVHFTNQQTFFFPRENHLISINNVKHWLYQTALQIHGVEIQNIQVFSQCNIYTST